MQRNFRFFLAVVLCFAWSSAVIAADAGVAAGPTDVTVEDFGKLKAVGRPALSPDGRSLAYALEGRIYVVSVDGGEPRTLTTGGSSASNPHWSRDGRTLFFISDRTGSNQLWKLPVGSFGEAEQVTHLDRGVDAINLSPDEASLLLTFDDGQEDRADPGDEESEPGEPWVINRLDFKEDAGDGYLTEAPSEHLYVYDIGGETLTQITQGRYTESDAGWSPDGKRLVFVSNREEDPDAGYETDLWTVPVGAAGDTPTKSAVVRLTQDKRVKHSPKWSPDGKSIAFISAEDGVYGIHQLGLVSVEGGGTRILTAELDRWVSSFEFSEDGRWIWFTFDNHGGTHLARIRLRDGEIERVIEGERTITAFDIDASGNAVARLQNMNDAPDLWYAGKSGLERLTDVNEAYFASRTVGSKEKVSFTVADGTVVEAFVTKPPGFEAGRRYPTILKIHGGPVGQFTYGYDFASQFFAANGYAVVEPNPRGSTGRGQDFVRAIYRTWGITDYPDVIGAVDHLIELGLADPERLFVTGYSYGGYMTNVVITETDRFRAAASGAGHSMIAANYGHDIYQKWYNWELGLPMENREMYDRLSPLLRASRVETPTIFLGGREDWNVPILNAELFYQALRYRGVDTQLVVYPDTHHGGWEPAYSKDYLERIVAWFNRYAEQ
jgi:dipeptidyl aminopeptidase/acylaminoacyl peptidase